MLLEKLERALVQRRLPGRSVVLAVSGGADSTALLVGASVLRPTLRLRLEVASVDHGLRPESREEVERVTRAAWALGLRCHEIRLRVAPGPGVEARAREARYGALERVRQALRADAIATAHTASDQAETVLMRLARGAALGGAAGILEARGRIVRPMLSCTRAEVLDFLTRRGVLWVEDPMNRDEAFLRVRIRKDVLPALERAAGPGVEGRLARFATWAAEDDALLDGEAAAARDRLLLVDGALDGVGLAALPPALSRRVLASLLEAAGLVVSAGVLERMGAAVREGGSATLPQGAVLRAQSGRVRIEREGGRRRAPVPAVHGRSLELNGAAVVLDEVGVEVRWVSAPGPGDWPVAQRVEVGGEHGPLVLRFRQPGDRVRTGGRLGRKLQDLLVDARIPQEQRNFVPLALTAGGAVVCAVGVWPRPGGRAGRGQTWVVARTSKGEAGAGPVGTL